MSMGKKPLTTEQKRIQNLKDQKKELRIQLIDLTTDTKKADVLVKELEKVTIDIYELERKPKQLFF